MQALIDAGARDDDFPALSLVISNVGEAFGLTRARQAGIEALCIDHRGFSSRQEFEAVLHEKLISHAIDMVCLAGFMRVLSPFLVKLWQGKIINIHPSILPAFQGLHTHRRVLETGCLVHGCTVHEVREALDDGPILVQGIVPVKAGDTADGLAKRVLSMEHRCYPLAAKMQAAALLRFEAVQPRLLVHDDLCA